MREARAILNLPNLLHNLEVVQTTAPRSKCIAMVKADAYGHGLVDVSKYLEHHAAGFGVCCLQEAVLLRKAGIKSEIILMEGVFSPTELDEANRMDLQTVIHHQQQLDWMQNLKSKYNKPVWLKVNTGMNRLGFKPEQFEQSLETLLKLSYEPILMTHLATADEPEHQLSHMQLSIFDELTAKYQLQRSCLNSAGIANFPEHQFDFVRPGLALYGVSPFARKHTKYERLKPVMTLEAEVISIQNLKAGEMVGYGAKWIAPHESKIAIISIGYGDGYPRDVPNGTPVLIGDAVYPSVGNVSMDMMAVDVTHASKPVSVGQLVCLWGEHNLVEDIAAKMQRIPYELVTQITARPRRVFQL